jgi:SAM-dependent methyltransferase
MKNIYKNIDNYYSSKIKTHGPTPKGVDWNGEKSQYIRFRQLSKIILTNKFSISDIGCGYGEYLRFLKENFNDFQYKGYDLSQEMIANAQKIYAERESEFLYLENLENIIQADYSIASGVFNVKMHFDDIEWLNYILDTLEKINIKSKKGFAFNVLTKYSNKEFLDDQLFYADPLFLFDYCKKNFASDVALLHDYELYEFTILVRKK